MAKTKSGSAKQKTKGRKAVMLWLTPDEYDEITAAAKHQGRSRAGFARICSLRSARSIRRNPRTSNPET